MARTSLALAPVLLLLAACGGPDSRVARSSDDGKAAKSDRTEAAPRGDERRAAKDARPSDRKVGDFFVYQFSGSFSERPLTLTEHVVAEEKGRFLVDFVLEDGESTSKLRVRFTADSPARVHSVSRVTDKGEIKARIADYDALMARTTLLPDSNDALVGTSRSTCLVGDGEHECEVTSYRVTLAGEEAVLTISRADGVARDVGGEILRNDGSVIYSARLVEHGNDKPKGAVARAR